MYSKSIPKAYNRRLWSPPPLKLHRRDALSHASRALGKLGCPPSPHQQFRPFRKLCENMEAGAGRNRSTPEKHLFMYITPTSLDSLLPSSPDSPVLCEL